MFTRVKVSVRRNQPVFDNVKRSPSSLFTISTVPMESEASISTFTAYTERPVLLATSAIVIPLSLSRSRSRMPSFTISREAWKTMGAQAIHSALA